MPKNSLKLVHGKSIGLQNVGMKNLALKNREIGGREIGGSDCNWVTMDKSHIVFPSNVGCLADSAVPK